MNITCETLRDDDLSAYLFAICRTLIVISLFHPSMHAVNIFVYSYMQLTFKYLSIHRSIDPSIDPSLPPSIHSFIHPSIHPSMHSTIHCATHWFICLCICFHLSIHPFIHFVLPPWCIKPLKTAGSGASEKDCRDAYVYQQLILEI